MKTGTKKGWMFFLLCVSLLRTVIGFYATFFGKKKSLDLSSTGDSQADVLLNDLKVVLDKQYLFSTNDYNKLLVGLLLIVLILALASWSVNYRQSLLLYLAYFVLSLVKVIYGYINTLQIANFYTAVSQRTATLTTAKFSLIIMIMIYAAISCFILYNLRSVTKGK